MAEGAVGLHFVVGTVGIGEFADYAILQRTLLAIHTEEFAGREGLVVFEAIAYGACQRVAIHLPKFCNGNLRRVHLEGCTHRREEVAMSFVGETRGMKYETCLVLERVDAVDDIVILVEVEIFGSLFRIEACKSRDVSIGIDVEQSFLEGIHLHSVDGLGGRHQLAVTVGDVHLVAIYYREVAYSCAYQTLRTPRAYTSHTEDDDTLLSESSHPFFTEKQFGSVEYLFVCHNRLNVRAYIIYLFSL